MARATILVIDPDSEHLFSLSRSLSESDFRVFSANSLKDGLKLLVSSRPETVLLSVDVRDGEWAEMIEEIKQIRPATSVIVTAETPSVPQAIEAMKKGASDYVEKSAKLSVLLQKIGEVLPKSQAAVAKIVSDSELVSIGSGGFHGLISKNQVMLDIFELIQTIADSFANVLIEGETGAGKELVARAIHQASTRRHKPFVTLDCSTLARELLESELFGHEKGAFTGATERHIGRFERANGGSLLLDEVANLALPVQSKLLRVLQTRTFERVGGTKPISVDVRIIAASNRPLEQCVADGTFREDLYHRLNVVVIDLPPLRERPEDIPLLADEFLRRFSRQHDKVIFGFSDAAMTALNAYSWPGNVRELENVVLQAVVLTKNTVIDLDDLPQRIQSSPLAAEMRGGLHGQLSEPERQILLNALRQHGGNIKRAAETLQVSRTTLYAKLKKFGIDPDAIR
jgi:DNA-binding NtrC family response regulator